MTKLYHPMSLLLWAIGLLATIVAVVGRLVPRLLAAAGVEPRGLLLLAAVLLLAAIATRAMAQPASS
jgi:hypothetical protein